MEKALNNKKTIRAWCMYDWANSAYNLTITTAIFPGYFEFVSNDTFPLQKVPLLGFELETGTLFSFLLSISFLSIIFVNLLLAGISDVYDTKKSFLKFFSTLGSIACCLLYFFDKNHYYIGCFIFIMATIGYAGSLAYYNSYLPQIVSPRLQDKVSAMGYSYGFVGSVILLITNLATIIFHEKLGIEKTTAIKISFLMVGVWWFLFASYSFSKLPKDKFIKKESNQNLFTLGLRDIIYTAQNLKANKTVMLYIISFFLYSAGIQTIMFLAGIFGTKELKLKEEELIPIILIIQLIAVVGAMLLARLSKKIGNITTLTICCVIWIGICIGAYFTSNYKEFCILAVIVGFMMGGVQSLSRSTFSKLLPADLANTSSFSFYEFIEKISIVLGTMSFGIINQITGGMRQSIIALIIYFLASIISFIILINFNKKALSKK